MDNCIFVRTNRSEKIAWTDKNCLYINLSSSLHVTFSPPKWLGQKSIIRILEWIWLPMECLISESTTRMIRLKWMLTLDSTLAKSQSSSSESCYGDVMVAMETAQLPLLSVFQESMPQQLNSTPNFLSNHTAKVITSKNLTIEVPKYLMRSHRTFWKVCHLIIKTCRSLGLEKSLNESSDIIKFRDIARS